MPTHPVRPLEWIDSAPIVVDRSVVIAAPPGAVWPHIADHESWPEWFTDLDRVERVGSGEGVGSGRTVFVGRISIEEEFTAWEPDAVFAFALTKTPLPFLESMAEAVELSGDDERCTVRYRQAIETKRFLGFLGNLAAKRIEGQLTSALKNLQRRVETGR
ncbi:MAG: SRPBCC family protein [Actinomycetota bacterium]